MYRRDRKFNDLLTYLNGQEEVLNYFLNIAFAIAPDEVLSRLICEPLGISDAGPFETFGRDIPSRYGWKNNENITQPDGFLATGTSLVGVELKLCSPSWPEQIAKYVALMAWEQMKTGTRQNLGLLFILPETSQQSHWSKVGLDEPGVDQEGPSTTRKCPVDFLDKLHQGKLPRKVRELFQAEASYIRG